MFCNQRQRIAGRDKNVSPQNQIAITISVTGCTQVGSVRRFHVCYQFGCIHLIRIRVVSAKVFERRAINYCAGRRAQPDGEQPDVGTEQQPRRQCPADGAGHGTAGRDRARCCAA